MTEDKKNAAIKECICSGCPSYVECKEQKAFCFTEKSKCIKERRGCICGGCPVHKKFNLKSGYYCFSGKEK